MAVLDIGGGGLESLARALAKLTRVDILVGVPDTNAQRKTDLTKAERDEILSDWRKDKRAARAAGEAPPPRPDALGGDDKSFSNAAIAYIAENGSPINNVPARPFMREGLEIERLRIAKLFQKAGRQAAAGDLDAMEQTFNAIGLVAANGMKTAIQEGDFQPLSQRTIDARLKRGRTGVKPLLDTGQLRNSISYILRRRGE